MKIKNLELRSEEVQDIITQIPGWIIRNGTIVILVIIAGLITGSYFYKYPDIIQSRVTLISINPPTPVFSEVSGKLVELFKKDNDHVATGEVIGVIENSGNYTHIMELKEQIRAIGISFDSPEKLNLTLKKDLRLGSIYPSYAQFISAYNEYVRFLKFDNIQLRIKALHAQAGDYKKYAKLIDEKVSVLKRDLKLSARQFERDSILNSSKAISAAEFERSHSQFLKQEYNYKNTLSEAYNTQIQRNQLHEQIAELTSQRLEQANTLQQEFKLSLENVLNQIMSWEQLYLLKAPISGKLSFTTVFNSNQYISTTIPVFTVVPRNQEKIIGRLIFPIKGAGNVRTGQKVNIKLDNYPYTEYGILPGRIDKISLIPFKNQDGVFYAGEISLPDGLLTNYKKQLPFDQEMQGVGEIVTKDRRLIDRLVEPMKGLFKER